MILTKVSDVGGNERQLSRVIDFRLRRAQEEEIMAATAEANAQARMIQAGAFDKKAQAEQIRAATAEAYAQAQIQGSAIGLTAPFDTNDVPYVIGKDEELFDELFDCVDENEPVEQAAAAAAAPGAATAATTAETAATDASASETAATAAAAPETVCAPTNVQGRYDITKELEGELRDIEVSSREATLKELRGNALRDQVSNCLLYTSDAADE